MLTKQPIFCNFAAALCQQTSHSGPLHFKQRHIVTFDTYLVPDFFGLAERRNSCAFSGQVGAV